MMPCELNDSERQLLQAVLLQAMADLRSGNALTAKDALDWLLDEPNEYLDAILDVVTGIHRDDIKRFVKHAFLED